MSEEQEVYDLPIEAGHVTVQAKSNEEAERKAASGKGKVEVIQTGEAFVSDANKKNGDDSGTN